MTDWTRRGVFTSLAAGALLAGCNNGVGSQGPARIDARVDTTLQSLYRQYPGTQDLAGKSAGILTVVKVLGVLLIDARIFGVHLISGIRVMDN